LFVPRHFARADHQSFKSSPIRLLKMKVREIKAGLMDGFTGLSDKRGVEIYENDIVLIDSFRDPGVFAIRFDYSNCCFEIFYPPVWRSPLASVAEARVVQDGFGCTHHFSMLVGYHIEVIGNLHENPELLEAKHLELEIKRKDREAKVLARVEKDLKEYNQKSWWHRLNNQFRIRPLYE